MPNCENCGSWVSEDYIRVMSRDGETVEACQADVCDNVRRGGQTRPERAHKAAVDESPGEEVVANE